MVRIALLPISDVSSAYTMFRQALGLLTGNNNRYTDLGTGNYAHQTWANEPPSPLCNLSQVIDMGYAAPSTTFADVMSTTGGEMCYFYL